MWRSRAAGGRRDRPPAPSPTTQRRGDEGRQEALTADANVSVDREPVGQALDRDRVQSRSAHVPARGPAGAVATAPAATQPVGRPAGAVAVRVRIHRAYNAQRPAMIGGSQQLPGHRAADCRRAPDPTRPKDAVGPPAALGEDREGAAPRHTPMTRRTSAALLAPTHLLRSVEAVTVPGVAPDALATRVRAPESLHLSGTRGSDLLRIESEDDFRRQVTRDLSRFELNHAIGQTSVCRHRNRATGLPLGGVCMPGEGREQDSQAIRDRCQGR